MDTPCLGDNNGVLCQCIAGWTGEAPAQAHNLNDAGSNPAPATNIVFTEAWCA